MSSFGGRLVVIKSVLTSLPLYYFSLYRAPLCVLKLLESARRKFFWGGSRIDSKISWVKWDTVLNTSWNGGVKYRVTKEQKLSSSREVVVEVQNRNRLTLGSDVEACNVPFKQSFLKTIGDSGSMRFWLDQWLGEDKLCNLFPHLYILELHPDVFVKDRCIGVVGSVISERIEAVWQWRRTPSGRAAGELSRLLQLISLCSFDNSKSDT
ncbi:uncharacterized mitochondrial protein AtMg00310-like [Rutidosis leptorrhynchoides]|uniref:uncharacterized mitochondrial protein AtMg00310-like n=1 Tax=Rutidosis leptorrhynchoides TaxID=125765 RepID=UPI003A99CBC5